ncbi:MAG: lipoate--protein ligase family protein [Acidimicrobiia bacterium]|nr:lipoate--protein ligase family protein [Acidimicrobiia bacterium]
MQREITIVTDRFPGRPGFDAAVSRAVLARVAAGDLSETLRLYVPERLVAFGSRDAVNPAFEAARAAAEAAGFGAYLRLAGGKAAVFHEQTIAFGWAIPTPDSRSTIDVRFDEIGAILIAALRGLGVDAGVGEVPGEYCPGAHSINAGGRTKLIGIGQRLIAGAAHVGGVVVVDRADLVNRALLPVYEALGYEWDPSTTGAIAQEVDTGVDAVMASIQDALAAEHRLTAGAIDEATMTAAAVVKAGAARPR